MSLKEIWEDLVDGKSEVKAQPINDIARAVIDIEEKEESGEFNGVTFTPSVSQDGVLSWTNDKGLENPPSVNLVQTVIDNLPIAEDWVL